MVSQQQREQRVKAKETKTWLPLMFPMVHHPIFKTTHFHKQGYHLPKVPCLASALPYQHTDYIMNFAITDFLSKLSTKIF